MMRYRSKGGRIKALRQAREREASQKELAAELRIGERMLREIENRDSEATRDLRELLVWLRRNDVWVYVAMHVKYLPEPDEARPKSDPLQTELRAVVAFGPPGEHGEDPIEVPIDHGRPYLSDPDASLPF